MIAAARAATLALALLIPALLASTWVRAAGERLDEAALAQAGRGDLSAPIAAAADEDYCSPALKRVLRRVLLACGLLGGEDGGRGCQPMQARNVATMSGDDFNALFLPMEDRGGIVQFQVGSADLDQEGRALLDQVFADRRGASYFFVVARASPDGPVELNRRLSKERAEAVMTHLQETFADPDLDREVGLLWLGEEYAQLDTTFCSWRRSGAGCKSYDLNRSAFVAWIDCRL
jgi:outer membrane protein OmpA-like peptidoglycan-associated protein